MDVSKWRAFWGGFSDNPNAAPSREYETAEERRERIYGPPPQRRRRRRRRELTGLDGFVDGLAARRNILGD